MDSIIIGKTSFLKGCAEDLTLTDFKVMFKAHNGIDLDKAFKLCGGKRQSVKPSIKSDNKK